MSARDPRRPGRRRAARPPDDWLADEQRASGGGDGPRRPVRRRSDLGGRVLVAVPAALFAIFVVSRGGPMFATAMVLLGFFCLHELYAMLESTRPVKLAGFLGLVALVAAALYGGQFQLVLVQMVLAPVMFALVLVGPRTGRATLGMAVTIFSIWWIGLAFAHAVLLRELPNGGGIIIDILVGTFLGDTGAYFGGRMYGRRALAPRLSPNKTVEGLLIGMVVAVFATWFAGLYQDWLPGTHALLLGIGVAIAAPIGDLFESLVKREAGTKDTGRLFGAHGGALDRLDAVFFTVVTGYYIWVALL